MSLSLHFQWTIQYPNHDFLEKDILYSFSTKKRWARLLQLLLSVPKEGVLSMHHSHIQLKAPHTMPTYRWEAWVGRAGGDCQAGMILPWLQQKKFLSSDCDSWKLYCSFFLRPEAQDQANNSAWLLLSVGEKKISQGHFLCGFFDFGQRLFERQPHPQRLSVEVCAFHWDVSKKSKDTFSTKAN